MQLYSSGQVSSQFLEGLPLLPTPSTVSSLHLLIYGSSTLLSMCLYHLHFLLGINSLILVLSLPYQLRGGYPVPKRDSLDPPKHGSASPL